MDAGGKVARTSFARARYPDGNRPRTQLTMKNEAGELFERAQLRNMDRARLAHRAPEVVAGQIDDHHVLGPVSVLFRKPDARAAVPNGRVSTLEPFQARKRYGDALATTTDHTQHGAAREGCVSGGNCRGDE